MRELALFAGGGGGILGGRLLGWRTVCAVESDPYARSVLLARQCDGCLNEFPIWDDVCTFDGYRWRGVVDVISGGFPCQDITAANAHGVGIAGPRSRLWFQMARIIGEVRPKHVFVENAPAIIVRGVEHVLGSLAALGYDARWGVLGASDLGAPHRRERFWLVANAHGVSKSMDRSPEFVSAVAERSRLAWWCQPGIQRVADGVADRVDRIKCTGNGQVPIVAAVSFAMLSDQHIVGQR